MGGFSDNYECGYWDDEELIPKSRRTSKITHTQSINKNYEIKSDKQYKYLYFILNSLEELSPEAQDSRNNFFMMNNTETSLEFKVDKESKSIELYDDDLFIGSLEKVFQEECVDNTKIVDDFCFVDNKLQDLEAFWDGERFYLRESLIPQQK